MPANDNRVEPLYTRIKNFSDIDFAKFVFELYIVRILEDFSDAKKSLSNRECIYNYLDEYINSIGEYGCIDYLNCIIDNL